MKEVHAAAAAERVKSEEVARRRTEDQVQEKARIQREANAASAREQKLKIKTEAVIKRICPDGAKGDGYQSKQKPPYPYPRQFT